MIEAFLAEQRALLDRLEAFAETPGFERLQAALRQACADGSDAWLAGWLIQPAFGLGQVPLEVIQAPDGIDRVERHLLQALTNPSAC
ncbi:antitoxin Xre/MbcA/ParS toxin-binding domain-containing protein [Paucibacter sp. R3-3]|uniref:Antitoxin Xre/MbcA/ParS toxin-binding domain-containing protein n=1 Tax=Roseateles agri TaxID=3098619 RepID=A0ABU5DET9_9BURK|nr:antitoxin Xre/MbcA/ParS toxin-binding domain-containing protein [Paucibacter sp. R3-3]MDY0744800.1 antitoxin Xre/MbcA/ParS toxin-binding domain-containing protein [Paucibacter sp. R3-3]